jgi:hypothetical protein
MRMPRPPRRMPFPFCRGLPCLSPLCYVCRASVAVCSLSAEASAVNEIADVAQIRLPRQQFHRLSRVCCVCRLSVTSVNSFAARLHRAKIGYGIRRGGLDADFYRLDCPGPDASGRGRLRRASNLSSRRLSVGCTSGCHSAVARCQGLSSGCQIGAWGPTKRTRKHASTGQVVCTQVGSLTPKTEAAL